MRPRSVRQAQVAVDTAVADEARKRRQHAQAVQRLADARAALAAAQDEERHPVCGRRQAVPRSVG